MNKHHGVRIKPIEKSASTGKIANFNHDQMLLSSLLLNKSQISNHNRRIMSYSAVLPRNLEKSEKNPLHVVSTCNSKK